MLQQYFVREMIRETPGADIHGFEHLLHLPKEVPCIIVYSHKAHNTTQLGNETRQITKLVNHADPGRNIHHIVRPCHSVGGFLRQAISPLHTVVITEHEVDNPFARSRVNKKVLANLAALVASERCSAITIAPDAGSTPDGHPAMVDAEKIHTQGVLKLRRHISALTNLTIPIVPISLNHQTRKISIGKPILDDLSLLPKNEAQQFLADRINELD